MCFPFKHAEETCDILLGIEEGEGHSHMNEKVSDMPFTYFSPFIYRKPLLSAVTQKPSLSLGIFNLRELDLAANLC